MAQGSSFTKRPLDVRDFEGHVAMLGGHCTWLDSFHEGERNFWIRFMKVREILPMHLTLLVLLHHFVL
jgi:hypothetical protein